MRALLCRCCPGVLKDPRGHCMVIAYFFWTLTEAMPPIPC